jgi:hypothetical protein
MTWMQWVLLLLGVTAVGFLAFLAGCVYLMTHPEMWWPR